MPKQGEARFRSRVRLVCGSDESCGLDSIGSVVDEERWRRKSTSSVVSRVGDYAQIGARRVIDWIQLVFTARSTKGRVGD